MIDTKQKIRRIFQLPSELQDVLFSEKVTEAIQAIGRKQALLIDKVGLLSDVITLVILGEIKAEVLPDELRKRGFPVEKVGSVVLDVNEQIFKPIRDSLKKITEEPSKQTPLKGDITPSLQSAPFAHARGGEGGAAPQQTPRPQPATQTPQPQRPPGEQVPRQAPPPPQTKPPLSSSIPARPSTAPGGREALADAIAALQKTPEIPVRPASVSSAPTKATSLVAPQPAPTPSINRGPVVGAPVQESSLPPLRTFGQDFTAAKLQSQVRSPMQEKKIVPPIGPSASAGPEKPKVDPYREPLS